MDVREVARDLGVRYILEGSVRRSENRLRFTGKLVDATSGVHIWADRFDGDMSDVFELQDRFSQSVVAAIEPSLQLAEIGRLKSKSAANIYGRYKAAQARHANYLLNLSPDTTGQIPAQTVTMMRELARLITANP